MATKKTTQSSEVSLQYPPNITGDTYMMFVPIIHNHSTESTASQDGSGNAITANVTDYGDGQPIALYHPEMLQSNAQIEWDASDTGMFGRGLDAYYRGKNSGSMMGALKAAGKEAAKDALIGGTIQDLINKNRGVIPNPRKTMFFRGIGFREFQFTFMFAPESKEESATVQKIIKVFKKYSHPSFTVGKYHLSYPPLWQIISMIKGKEIVSFKKSVVTAVNVDFSPNSVLSTFEDGSPVNIKLEISFKESEIVTAGDFDKAPGFGY